MIATGPTSHSFISQRQRLHYVEWGDPGAPPLLLLHGGRDHCRSWDWVAQAFSSDWRIIAPDLRGHGDSAWSPDGDYSAPAFLYDLAQLIHQLKLAPLAIVAHSLGGMIALRYAGIYPEAVHKLVAVEGLGFPVAVLGAAQTPSVRIREWIDAKRSLSSRLPRRYPTLDEAYQRMKAENKYLTEEQARHLTIHGISQNEDGTYSWKFDQYVRAWPPVDLPPAEIHKIWNAIACPTLLCYGEDSWASNPAKDGQLAHFRDARVESFPRAGHWLHHDQFDRFTQVLRDFL